MELANLYLEKIEVLKKFGDILADESKEIATLAEKVIEYRGWKSAYYDKAVEFRSELIQIDNKISQKKKLLPHGV